MELEGGDDIEPTKEGGDDDAQEPNLAKPDRVETAREPLPQSNRRLRGEAQQKMQEEIAALKKQISEGGATSELQRELREAREELATFRGRFEQLEKGGRGAGDEKAQAAYDAKVKAAKGRYWAALNANDQGGVDAAMDEIADLRAERAIEQYEKRQKESQTPQGPSWLPRIEAEFGEVVDAPGGRQLADAFYMAMAKREGAGAATARKAFARAATELGIKPPAPPRGNGQARAQNLGIPRSQTRSEEAPGERTIDLPKGWEEVAKKSGMSKERYKEHYAAMHPEAVKDE